MHFPLISIDFVGFPSISADFPWISFKFPWIFVGCPLISLAFHGLPWISLDFHGFPCISYGFPMGFHAFRWISYGFPRISIDFHRLSMDLNGFQQIVDGYLIEFRWVFDPWIIVGWPVDGNLGIFSAGLRSPDTPPGGLRPSGRLNELPQALWISIDSQGGPWI